MIHVLNLCYKINYQNFSFCFQSDPKQVCTALGLCTSMKNKKVDAKLIMSSLPMKTILAPALVAVKPKLAAIKSKPYKASPECILCEWLMEKLETILKQNATKVLSK